MLGLVYLLIVQVLVVVVSSKPSYYYDQCDSRWANDTMGVEGPGERASICKEGCAMTCVAMALTQRGFTLENGDIPTPKSLNRYLVENQGYRCDSGDCNNLVLSKPDDITKGFFQFVGGKLRALAQSLEHNHSNTITQTQSLKHNRSNAITQTQSQNGAEGAAEATTRNLH